MRKRRQRAKNQRNDDAAEDDKNGDRGSAREMAERGIAEPQALEDLGSVDLLGGRNGPVPCNATSTTGRLPVDCIRLSLRISLFRRATQAASRPQHKPPAGVCGG